MFLYNKFENIGTKTLALHIDFKNPEKWNISLMQCIFRFEIEIAK